ncbi:DUF3987 domain-containing protein [Methylobacterium sp. P1-11]|uniref:YfjI family protein n=1 Tax=Methylobacterium sp. P1-11 TaxID=2024616 RepID=UPI0011EC753E|nr:YfjI family protein [Methylobacterium sp. P1-11]KAA0113500.1 DUF3987 domain-containing protein [Methylobacterium sp. P1-11]
MNQVAHFASELDRLKPNSVGRGEPDRRRDNGRSDEGADRLPLFSPLPPSRPFPVNALGPVLSEGVNAIARKVQVPSAIAAQSVLSVASLIAQALADVRMPYGQLRPLSLFLLSIGGSGDRKTTSDQEALRPLTQWQSILDEIYQVDRQNWLVEHAAWVAEHKKIGADRKLGFLDRKIRLSELGPEPQPPLHPFMIVPEPTFEGLVKNWSELHPSLGLFTTEGGAFLGGFNMSAENRLRSAANFSLLWDGAAITRLRAHDGVLKLKGRRLALHLMIQPSAAAEFLSDAVLRDQGLHSRILLAAPDSIAGTRLYRPVCKRDENQICRYQEQLLALLRSNKPVADDRTQGLVPRALPMSAAAEQIWRDFHDDVERRLGAGGDLIPIRDLAAKAAEHAARIAGVLTIVANVHSSEILERVMINAVEITIWYLGEAQRLRGAGRTDPKLLNAQALLTWMRDQPDGICRFRDLVRLGPVTARSAETAEISLKILSAHGWVVEICPRPRTFRAYPEEVADG